MPTRIRTERKPNQEQDPHHWHGKAHSGKHVIAFGFTYDGGGIGKGGTGTPSVDGKKAAEGRIEKTIPFRFSLDESFDVGQDTGTPVIDEYDAKMPFQFNGTLRNVKLGPDKLTRTQGVPSKSYES